MSESNAPHYRAHPWHGVPLGTQAPQLVNAFIEIVPSDTVKYEVDKETGILKLDRPQRYSNQCPTLYGFLPRTYCGSLVGKRCSDATGTAGIIGDGDPLDVCVITEKVITHGDIIVQAVPIGGLRMIDAGTADDKIIAVLSQDSVFSEWKSLQQIPTAFLDRLRHYFLTYKDMPGSEQKCKVEIAEVYDAAEAREVIRLSQLDYQALIENAV